MPFQSGFQNGVVYALNANFSGAATRTGGEITTDGQLLIGSTATPNIQPGVLTSPSGSVTIGYAAPNITLDVVTGGAIWVTTSVNVANMAIEHGYFCVSPGGALTLGLPTTSALGDTLNVSLSGATSWQITQAAGQQIFIGSSSTTLGAGGSLTSTAAGDSIELVCLTANTVWVVQNSIGNITVV